MSQSVGLGKELAVIILVRALLLLPAFHTSVYTFSLGVLCLRSAPTQLFPSLLITLIQL